MVKKTLLVATAMLFIVTLVNAQNIKTTDLIEALNRPVGETQRKLVSKGWEFYKDDKDPDFKNSKTWVYGVTDNWFTLKYDGNRFRQVRYTFEGQDEYKTFMNYLRSVEAEKKSTRETDNLLINEYVDKGVLGNVYTIGILKNKGKLQTYFITVINKAAYIVLNATSK